MKSPPVNILPCTKKSLAVSDLDDFEISEQISGGQQAEGGNGQNSSTDNSLTPSRDRQLQLSRRISLGQKLETASQRLDLPSFKFKQSSKESSKNEEVSGQWLCDGSPTLSFLGSVF